MIAGAGYSGNFTRGFYLLIYEQPAAVRIESRQLIALPPENGDTVGFQPFARRRQIENYFRTRAHNNDRCLGQLRKVRGDIAVVTAVDTADPAVAKHLYPGSVGDKRGGGPVVARFAFWRRRWKVAARDLADILPGGQELDLSAIQSDVNSPSKTAIVAGRRRFP